MAPNSTEGKNPVVLGRIGSNPAVPTVAFYGHYDVQPAEEPDWRSNPFSLTAVDGYLYGRGTSDNKGPILAFIYAVKVGRAGCWVGGWGGGCWAGSVCVKGCAGVGLGLCASRGVSACHLGAWRWGRIQWNTRPECNIITNHHNQST